MTCTQTYVVIGAGGPTGLACVKRLLWLGFRVVAVVRNPEKYATVFPQDERFSVVHGDVTDKDSLEPCLQGANGVIFTAAGKGFVSAQGVENKGVLNVAELAKKLKVEHVVLVTSALVTPKNRLHPVRILLNNMRWGLMDEKFKGEENLRASGIPYTIVRPGRLTDKEGTDCKLILGQGDASTPTTVSRFHVAAICCAAVTNKKARNRTFELFSQEMDGAAKLEDQLESAFDGLEPGKHD